MLCALGQLVGGAIQITVVIVIVINDNRTIVTRLMQNYRVRRILGEQDIVSLGLVKTVVRHWLLV